MEKPWIKHAQVVLCKAYMQVRCFHIHLVKGGQGHISASTDRWRETFSLRHVSWLGWILFCQQSEMFKSVDLHGSVKKFLFFLFIPMRHGNSPHTLTIDYYKGYSKPEWQQRVFLLFNKTGPNGMIFCKWILESSLRKTRSAATNNAALCHVLMVIGLISENCSPVAWRNVKNQWNLSTLSHSARLFKSQFLKCYLNGFSKTAANLRIMVFNTFTIPFNLIF